MITKTNNVLEIFGNQTPFSLFSHLSTWSCFITWHTIFWKMLKLLNVLNSSRCHMEQCIYKHLDIFRIFPKFLCVAHTFQERNVFYQEILECLALEVHQNIDWKGLKYSHSNDKYAWRHVWGKFTLQQPGCKTFTLTEIVFVREIRR